MSSASQLLGIDPIYLYYDMMKYTSDVDVVFGLVKSFVYGGIIALIGCYKGLTCGMGAEGVGRATTEAVVYSSITILISNFFLTLVLQRLYLLAVMIEVRQLKKSFGPQPVLGDVNLRIENGESVGDHRPQRRRQKRAAQASHRPAEARCRRGFGGRRKHHAR